MHDGVRAKIEAARERAVYMKKLSRIAEEAERRRNDCLYDLFDDLHGIESDLRKMSWEEKRKIFGDLLNFRTARQLGGLVLRQVARELDTKKRTKYAAVLRYVVAQKPPKETVRDFVRKNGGINGCDVKERKLRRQAARRSRA